MNVIISREAIKILIENDMLKNTTNKSKWNPKIYQITHRKTGKKKGNEKQRKQVENNNKMVGLSANH
jgi:predicted sugar kinase